MGSKSSIQKRYFTSKITAYNFPFSFIDEMQKGDLKDFHHQHIFEEKDGGTLMTDIVHLEAPYGLVGKFVLWLF
jgi:ligand-binding SRPBCC domain-containing protein